MESGSNRVLIARLDKSLKPYLRIAAVIGGVIGSLTYLQKQGDPKVAPGVAWILLALGVVLLLIGFFGFVNKRRAGNPYFDAALASGISVVVACISWLALLHAGAFGAAIATPVPTATNATGDTTSAHAEQSLPPQTQNPSVTFTAESTSQPKETSSAQSQREQKAASSLTLSGVEATDVATTTPPARLAILRTRQGEPLHPLESALAVALRDMKQPAGEAQPPIEVAIRIDRQSNPPTGKALFAASIQLSRKGKAPCAFLVEHQEQRFSAASPVFESATLAPVLEDIRAEIKAYSTGMPAGCRE